MKNFKSFLVENRAIPFENPIGELPRPAGNPPELDNINSQYSPKVGLKPKAITPTNLNNKHVIDSINSELDILLSMTRHTPTTALSDIRKTLIKYGINLELEDIDSFNDEDGEEVFRVYQYGQKGPTDFGALDMTNNHMFDKHLSHELFLYLIWALNEHGFYDIFAYVANTEEIDYLLSTDLDGTSLLEEKEDDEDEDEDGDNEDEDEGDDEEDKKTKKEDLDNYTVEISLPVLVKLMEVLKEQVNTPEDFSLLFESLLSIESNRLDLSSSGAILDGFKMYLTEDHEHELGNNFLMQDYEKIHQHFISNGYKHSKTGLWNSLSGEKEEGHFYAHSDKGEQYHVKIDPRTKIVQDIQDMKIKKRKDEQLYGFK